MSGSDRGSAAHGESSPTPPSQSIHFSGSSHSQSNELIDRPDVSSINSQTHSFLSSAGTASGVSEVAFRQKLRAARIELEKEARVVDLEHRLERLAVENQALKDQLDEAQGHVRQAAHDNANRKTTDGDLASERQRAQLLAAENELLVRSQKDLLGKLETLTKQRDSWDPAALRRTHEQELAVMQDDLDRARRELTLAESQKTLLEADKAYLAKALEQKDAHAAALERQLATRNPAPDPVKPPEDPNELRLLMETFRIATGQTLGIITQDLARLHDETERTRHDTSAQLHQVIRDLRDKQRRMEIAHDAAIADAQLQQLQLEKRFVQATGKLRLSATEHARAADELARVTAQLDRTEHARDTAVAKFQLVRREFHRLHRDIVERLRRLAAIEPSHFENPSEDWRVCVMDVIRYLGNAGWSDSQELVAADSEVATAAQRVPTVKSSVPADLFVGDGDANIHALHERLERALRDRKRVLHIAHAILAARKDYRRLLKVLRLLVLSTVPSAGAIVRARPASSQHSSPNRPSTASRPKHSPSKAPFRPPGIAALPHRTSS